MKSKKLLAIGECLFELCHTENKQFTLNYGGDIVTATRYLARYKEKIGLSVDLLTAIGTDLFSDDMLSQLKNEGVGIDLITRSRTKFPGAYLMHPDSTRPGFCYYRDNMAAKELFQIKQNIHLADKLPHYDFLYLSINTVSMLSTIDQENLMDLLHLANSKKIKIILSCYYYPQPGSVLTPIRNLIQRIWVHTDICFVDFDNQQTFFPDKDPRDTAERLYEWGVVEPVVSYNHQSYCFGNKDNLQLVSLAKPDSISDITGAHYGFEAGYIAARIKGDETSIAVTRGHQLANAVMQHRGAILDAEHMPELF